MKVLLMKRILILLDDQLLHTHYVSLVLIMVVSAVFQQSNFQPALLIVVLPVTVTQR